jgi:hypothetical protein
MIDSNSYQFSCYDFFLLNMIVQNIFFFFYDEAILKLESTYLLKVSLTILILFINLLDSI